MKNFRYHRVFASISAGTALMLVLSSCTTFSAKKEDSPEHPAASSSHSSYNSHGVPEKPDNCPEPGKFNPAEATSSATASASVSPSATPSASGGEVRTVGLTDNNKAGKPRPRPQGKVINDVTVNEDGSWKYHAGSSDLTVNADGTWSYRSKTFGQREATLHADGSWDITNNEYSKQEKMHVNPDGSWDTTTKYEAKEGKAAEEHHEQVRPDGSWEQKGPYQTIVGSADGTVTLTYSDGKQGSTFSSSEWSLVEPFDYKELIFVQKDHKIKYGVGDGGVIPLMPRAPLPRGVKAAQAPVGSEQERIALAQQQRLVLTDDNKAGKEPRRRETESYDRGLGNVDLKDDGSYSYSTKEGEGTAEVAADGTWKAKSSDGSTATLNADGSWDSYTEKPKVNTKESKMNVHVNSDGTWVKNFGKNVRAQMFADGSWCYDLRIGDGESSAYYGAYYGTSEGKIYGRGTDGEWHEADYKAWDERRDYEYIEPPHTATVVSPVKDGVVPLMPRVAVAAGQKAFS